MYFIRQGVVEVFNPAHDNPKPEPGSENTKNDKNENRAQEDQPILYLPKFSYFGDYQILYNLKSNIIFRTLAEYPD
jgi:hypothetical protein